METKKQGYIDILRGIAIILVVECHTARLIPAQSRLLDLLSDLGTLGVQLFFVASALTLCLSMHGRGASRPAITAFYIRRFFRIAPLYYVGIALYGALSAYYLAAGTPERYNGDYSAANVLANVLLLHGLYLPANNNIVPGGWSIGCEVLFYALFPYLFRRIQDEVKCQKFIVFALILNLGIQWIFVSSLPSPDSMAKYPFLTYFFLNQLPVFGMGMLLYFSLQREARAPYLYLMRFIGFFAIVAFLFAFDASIPWVYALIPTLSALSFFYLGRFFSIQSCQGWFWDTLASIGRKSYSIYIFHFLFAWDILGTTSFLLRFPPLRSAFVAWPTLLCFNLVVSYGLAIFTARFIENTGIEAGRRMIRAWKLHEST